MKSSINRLLIFLGFIFVVISCGTPKQAVTETNAFLPFDTLIERVNITYQQVSSLSGRYNIDISTGREETSVVAQIRYLRDSVLWASVYVIPAMELFRVLLTPDSVKMIDRVHETYLMGKIDQWSTLLPVSLNYAMIVRLLIPHLRLSSFEICYNCSGHLVASSSSHVGYDIEITGPGMSKSAYALNDKAQLTSVVYKTNQEIVDIKYKSYKKNQNLFLPDRINISTRGRNKLKIGISNVKLDVNVPVEMPFKIPKTYKRLSDYGGF